MTDQTPDPIAEHVMAMHRTAAIHARLAVDADGISLLKARVNASVGCFQAARFLWALKEHAPDVAAELLPVVLEECEIGAVLPEAADWFGALGGDPSTWDNDVAEYTRQLSAMEARSWLSR